MKEEAKDTTFHSESAVARLAMWANVVAWIILAFAAISFIYDLYSIISQWAQIVAGLPANPLERFAIFISKVFMNPAVGVFYFLVLRGISELLNLGRDLFYGGFEETEEDEKTEAASA